MNDLDDIVNSEATIEQICKYVSDHNINKKSIIANANFKEKLYKELSENGFSYSCIRKVVETFGTDECIKNIDVDRIKGLKSAYRYLITLSEYNGSEELLKKVVNDNSYYDYFFKNINNCYSCVENANYDDIKKIIDKISNEPEKYDNLDYFFRGINNDSKKKLLKEDLKYDITKEIVSLSNSKIQQEFINNDPRALFMCKDFDILKMSKNGIHFPNDIMRQDYFFEKLKVDNFVDFRRNINVLYRNNYSSIIQRKVDKYREGIINSYDKEKGIFKDYDIKTQDQVDKLYENNKSYILDGDTKYNILKNIGDKEKLENYLKSRTSEKLSEVIVDSLFNDTKKNVNININEMLRYNNHLDDDKKVLDNNKVDFYNIIKKLSSISNDKKIELYENLKNKDIMSDFYNDISILRKMSYKEISESLFKTEENVEDFCVEASEKNNLKVYKLEGKPFNMLVRALNMEYHEKTNSSESCYSLISNKNLNVFENGRVSYLYGYDKLDPNRIINVFEGDSYTMDDQNLTNRANRIMSPDEIAESSPSFSEINIKNELNEDYDGKEDNCKYKEMRPTYLVSMKEITKEQIDESKRLGIPIVMIDKERYKTQDIKQIEEDQYDLNIN